MSLSSRFNEALAALLALVLGDELAPVKALDEFLHANTAATTITTTKAAIMSH